MTDLTFSTLADFYSRPSTSKGLHRHRQDQKKQKLEKPTEITANSFQDNEDPGSDGTESNTNYQSSDTENQGKFLGDGLRILGSQMLQTSAKLGVGFMT